MTAPRISVATMAVVLCVTRAMAADFSVSTPGGQFAFAIANSTGQSLGNSPTLTLVRGRTYTFAVSTASNHPFQILSPGVKVGNDTSSGTITYTVATNAPAMNNPGYDCSIHHFSGIILTVDPPVPPVPRIVSYSFGTEIVLRSSPATNTFTIIPEFKTNLNTTNWVALTVLSNRFAGGTNETFCGRPPGTNVFIRVRAQ